MLRKAELGELRVNLPHDPVAADFGDDAGCRDGERFAVAFDDRVIGIGEITDGQAVYQAVLRLPIERFHGPPHRQVGGAQDVDPVDFLMVGGGDGPDETRRMQ